MKGEKREGVFPMSDAGFRVKTNGKSSAERTWNQTAIFLTSGKIATAVAHQMTQDLLPTSWLARSCWYNT